MPSGDSGFPRADAEADFLRVRRQQLMSKIGSRLFGSASEPTLSLSEVLDAVGTRGERGIGVRVIPIDHIVGSVDKVRDFDPLFRPTSGRSRARWERLAEAVRRGQEIPPIDVYQVGDYYFVRDGHHRVSVTRALGGTSIEADVTRVNTLIEPEKLSNRDDLQAAELRRIFLERVPLDRLARREISCVNPWHYTELAEMVEAWVARLMFREKVLLGKAHAASRWYAEEYVPVTMMLSEAGLVRPDESEADAFLRLSHDRYSLVRAHVWTEEVFDGLREAADKK